MNLKKLMLMLMSIALLSTNTVIYSAGENINNVKKEVVNVAENKPVTSNAVHGTSYPLTNLVDGDRETFIVPEYAENNDLSIKDSNEEIVIDLQRRYKVEKIEIFDRYNQPDEGGRRFFDIIGANNADFSDGVVIGGMKKPDDSIFPDNGPFTAIVDGKNAYRYIKFKRTGGYYYGYSEFLVYAQQTATEVAQGKSVVADDAFVTDKGYVYAPELAVNGTNKDSADCWASEIANENYHFMRVDFGEPLNIGMIEMEGRNFEIDKQNDNIYSRRFIDLYASNENVQDSILTTQKRLTSDQGYKKLASIKNNNPYDGLEKFPPLYRTDNTYKTGYFQATCDDSEAFRYLTLKKTYKNQVAIGELRAYVINPVVNSIDLDDNNIYISFSDEMNAGTINQESIVLTDKLTKENALANVSQKDAYTFAVDISGLDKNHSYTLTLNKNLKNMKNVPLAENYVKTFSELKRVTINNIVYKDAPEGNIVGNLSHVNAVFSDVTVTNNSSVPENINVFNAIYDNFGKLLKVKKTEAELPAGVTKIISDSISSEANFEEGSEIRTYIWDDDMVPYTLPLDIESFRNEFYVSPDGSDENSGTLNEPFRTIERAQRAVRAENRITEKDITVYLKEGVYPQNKTLVFDEDDGGFGTNKVTYKAYNNENAVISGGEKITGWKAEENGLYSAKVTGFDNIRNLYVNGKKAQRAQSKTKVKPVSMYTENGKITGYVMNTSDMGVFKNPQDIQFRYARAWETIICNVAEIINNGENTTVKMKMPEFDYITNTDKDAPHHNFLVNENHGFYIENAFELLDEPGEFYYDKATRTIYYMPDGENMQTAEVYAPKLEQLMVVQGSDIYNKVNNLDFEGLTFAHTKADYFDNGYLGGQAQGRTNIGISDDSYPLDDTMNGAAVRLRACENVNFTNNKFMGISSVALGLYEGATDIKTEGNVFYDIGDSAVTVGLPSDAYVDDGKNGVNVALHKKTTASGQERLYPAKYGNDGQTDGSRGWNIIKKDGDYSKAWWQVDLGRPYKIDEIRVLPRKGYDNMDLIRKNFEVLGSNDPEFNTGVTVLATCGDTPFSTVSGFKAAVNDNNEYRYVRVRKTRNEYFFLSELEVISNDKNIAPLKEVCRNVKIYNNYITRIGNDNNGAPGIQTYYTDSVDIAHNHIKDVPYSGICLGWGWSMTADSVTSKNNLIRDNLIEDYAKVCFDAGGIYTLGQQPGSVISGNYIKGQNNPYAALYPDSGSKDYIVENNVIENADVSIFVYSKTGQENLTYRNNYSTNPVYEHLGINCSVEAPKVFVPGIASGEVKMLMENAGLTDAFANIGQSVPSAPRVYTDAEIYDNVVSETHKNSMYDKKFLIYCIENKIKEAESVLDIATASGSFSQSSIAALTDALNDAKSVADSCNKVIKKAQKSGVNFYDVCGYIDRDAVISARCRLIKQMTEFMYSIK